MSAIPGINTTFLSTALGPLLIGGLVSSAFYGITCAQTFVYFQRSHADRPMLKALVLVLWLIDSFDIFLNGHILYWYLVSNYANPAAMASPVWSILLHVSITALSNFLVRGMFTFRVWRMSQGNWFLTVFIFVLSFLDLVCSIAITVKAFHTTFAGLQRISPLLYLDFAAVFSADAAVALSLCYFLHISRTGIRKTDSLINILIMYTVNTGLLTALCASAGLITFAVMPNNLIYIAFYLQLSKLYLNAYLATLNARENLRERTEDIVSISLSRLSHLGRNYSEHAPTSSQLSSPVNDNSKHRDTLPVLVATEVDTRSDAEGAKSEIRVRRLSSDRF